MNWEWNAWTIVWFVGVCVAAVVFLAVFFSSLADFAHYSDSRGTQRSKEAAQTLSIVMVAGPFAVLLWPAVMIFAILFGIGSVFREAVAEVD